MVSRSLLAIHTALTYQYCEMRLFATRLLFVIFAITQNYCVFGFYRKLFKCGPLGFICESNNKIRLCDSENTVGPAFLCPSNTRCNEDSTEVCENIINYMGSSVIKSLRCYRSERIADPNVPDCKGYIICIPNKNRFQGIKLKCPGNTIFNGLTRTCTSGDTYKCPITNITKTSLELFSDAQRDDAFEYYINTNQPNSNNAIPKNRVIECKDYKLSVTQDNTPVKTAYFCPSRPVLGEMAVRCTIFSNQFCITLERDDEDQFVHNSGVPFRRPRM